MLASFKIKAQAYFSRHNEDECRTPWPGCAVTISMEIKMPQLKLTYFDFDGGRGEPIRLALAIGGLPFEDFRFPVSEFPVLKDQFPLHQVPVLELDGKVITQSNAIIRYVGKLTGLYPDDALQALHCDEALDVVEDILSQIVVTFRMEDEEEKRVAREALAAGPISLYLGRLESMLTEIGGSYFAGDRLSVADLKVFLWIRSLKSGLLDYVPGDIVDRVAPKLLEHLERISAEPGIVAYYEQRAANS